MGDQWHCFSVYGLMPTTTTADGNVMFSITARDSSTMTFTAPDSNIGNGSLVSCSSTTRELRMIFNQTVEIFGKENCD